MDVLLQNYSYDCNTHSTVASIFHPQNSLPSSEYNYQYVSGVWKKGTLVQQLEEPSPSKKGLGNNETKSTLLPSETVKKHNK